MQTGCNLDVNLDVKPFLEALGKMRGFYTDFGIDIFKDAVSLPGVSMNYVLCGTLNRPNAPKLFAPGPEAYEMLILGFLSKARSWSNNNPFT